MSHDNFKLENCSVPGFCHELAWICVNLQELLSIAATYWLNNKKIYLTISLPQTDLRSQTDLMCAHTLQKLDSKLEYYDENQSGRKNPEFNKSSFK